MACVGLRGFLLASAGLRWPSLVVVGCYGPALAVCCQLACVGCLLACVAVVGLRWPAIGVVVALYIYIISKGINKINRTHKRVVMTRLWGGVGAEWVAMAENNTRTSHNDSFVV